MKAKDNYSEIIKVRVKDYEKEAILKAAEENHTSTSAIIRETLFGPYSGSSYTDSATVSPVAITIQRNLARNAFLNRILQLHISAKTKEKLVEELKSCMRF